MNWTLIERTETYLVLSSTVKWKASRNLLVRDIGEFHGIRELGPEACEKPISIIFLCLSVHIISMFGFAADYLPLFLSSVADCDCQQLLYTWTRGRKLISLFPASTFLEKGFDWPSLGLCAWSLDWLVAAKGMGCALGEHGRSHRNPVDQWRGVAGVQRRGRAGRTNIWRVCTAAKKTISWSALIKSIKDRISWNLIKSTLASYPNSSYVIS